MRWLASNSFTFKEAIKSSISNCSLSFTSDILKMTLMISALIIPALPMVYTIYNWVDKKSKS